MIGSFLAHTTVIRSLGNTVLQRAERNPATVTTRVEAAQYLKDAGGLKLVVFGADGDEVAAMFGQGSVTYDDEEATFIAVAEDGNTVGQRLCRPYRAMVTGLIWVMLMRLALGSKTKLHAGPRLASLSGARIGACNARMNAMVRTPMFRGGRQLHDQIDQARAALHAVSK